MLTGRLPHDEPTIARQLAAVVAKRPTPVEQLRPDVPRELSQLVRGLLQKQPDRRPDDAAAVIQQLDGLSESVELTMRGSATSLSDSRRRRTKRQTPSWVRSFSRPQSWLVLAAFLFPGLLTYQFADRIFPLRIDSQPLTQTFPPGELSEPLPTIAERQEETITLVCGAVANTLFAVGAQGRAASSDYVNLAYQPTYVRSSPVMPFEVSALPADRRCVDALLTLTLKGGATSSGQRTVRVYAVDRDAETVDSQAALQRLMESGAAISVGQWTFNNAGYRRNGVPDGISFSSSRLIDFLNNAESDVVTLFLWRQDASNGQTHIYADPAKPELLPQLWLKLAGP